MVTEIWVWPKSDYFLNHLPVFYNVFAIKNSRSSKNIENDLDKDDILKGVHCLLDKLCPDQKIRYQNPLYS